MTTETTKSEPLKFELINELVRISNITNRIEFHGDDEKTAHDIKIEASLHNSVLSKLSPTLKESIYMKDPGATEDLINPDHMPKLKNPEMSGFDWDHKLKRVEFRILHGERAEDDIVFNESKVKKNLHVDPQEGGTVFLEWTVQVVQEDEMHGARLLSTLGKSVRITMTEDESQPEEQSDKGEAKPDNVVGLFDANAQNNQTAPAGDDDTDADTSGDSNDEDDQYQEACAFARGQNTVSISVLKRELKISAQRATRILERMQEDGYIDPANAQGVHEVQTIPA